jgi:predicted DNA-binding transcriptional regulator AlpA
MLSREDLALARELLEKVREVTRPRTSPFVRPGELGAPDLLDCSRTTAWKATKDPTFPRPLVMGPRRFLYKRGEVEAWRDGHRADAGPEKESPPGAGARRGASFDDSIAVPTATHVHSSTTTSIHRDVSPKTRRRTSAKR